MKQTIQNINAARAPAVNSLQTWVNGFALALLAAVIPLISACDPGGSGDGIDPGVVEIPVAYIRRPVPLDDQGDEVQADVREPRLFSQGGDVYLRDNSSADGEARNITRSETLGMGDVKGLNVSHDGTKIIFSLRLFDPDPNNAPFPSWNIYEYDVELDQLRRIITSATIAEEGDDLFPSYLPDGRIVFTSDRQRQTREMQRNEIKPAFSALDENENVQAFVLHVMNADGTDIHQISFNQSHDLYPQVLTHYQPGRIAFSRWDNAAGNNEINIYTVNPDGSDLQILYGARSHNTGTNGSTIQFTNFRETEDGDLMVITRPFTDTFDGGDIELIGVDRFVDNFKPLWSLSGLPGPAQIDATVSNVNNSGALSVNGRYASVYPLWDGSNRMLVSKSTCQLDINGVARPCVGSYLSDPDAVEKSPAYSIWLYDMDVDTQKPIVLAEAGMVITEAITVQARTRAPVIFDRGLLGQLDTDWATDIVGAVHIRSVYDMGDGSFNGCFFAQCTGAVGITTPQDFADPVAVPADQRPARFVRFIKPVAIPDPDDPEVPTALDLDGNAFGPQRNRGMREIVGYAPVEPDGSVKVKVPANIPLGVEVLDAEGRRIGPRHDNWFQVQPGDTLTCVGCHDLNNGGNPPEIHARSDGEAPSINAGMPASQVYVNTQNPFSMPLGPYVGVFQQSMAEVRFDGVPTANEPTLTADLVYDDYWTDPGMAVPTASYAYRYADLDPGMLAPTNSFCQPWAYNCRVTINFPDHIQAIFELDRGPDNFTPMPPTNPPNANEPTNTALNVDNMNQDLIGDYTCVTCHTTDDGNGGTQLPYGQLDLTQDPNRPQTDRYRAYQQMFGNRLAQFFDAGGMTLQPLLDGNGVQVEVQPIMTSAGARSSFFVEKMSGTELDAGRAIPATTFDHTVMLSGAELKLIDEWLDLGAQNFNDPFDPDAPQN